MKALTTLKSAINQSSLSALAALITLSPVFMPHLALASQLQTQREQQAQIFEINVSNSPEASPKSNIQNSISINDISQQDPLVMNLDAFLAAKQSPLAGNAATLVTYPRWERALAISVVESNMCRFTPKVRTKQGWIESYNCSGIGGTNYKMYDSYLGWFKDMTELLGKPNYINRPIEKFIGYYVVPGGANWLNGVKKTEKDFKALIAQSDSQRQEIALAQINAEKESNSLLTFAYVGN